MDGAIREGLSAAADVLSRIMRAVAGVKTNETAAAVNVNWNFEDVEVRAGYPGGEWGWTPIQALMFDNNKRHPLYGNRRHWYHEGYYPITEATVRIGADEATEAFADAAVDRLLEEHGL